MSDKENNITDRQRAQDIVSKRIQEVLRENRNDANTIARAMDILRNDPSRQRLMEDIRAREPNHMNIDIPINGDVEPSIDINVPIDSDETSSSDMNIDIPIRGQNTIPLSVNNIPPIKSVNITPHIESKRSPMIQTQESIYDSLFLLLFSYGKVFFPLFVFITVFALIIHLLYQYIQFKFKGIIMPWFFSRNAIPFDQYFEFVVNTMNSLNPNTPISKQKKQSIQSSTSSNNKPDSNASILSAVDMSTYIKNQLNNKPSKFEMVQSAVDISNTYLIQDIANLGKTAKTSAESSDLSKTTNTSASNTLLIRWFFLGILFITLYLSYTLFISHFQRGNIQHKLYIWEDQTDFGAYWILLLCFMIIVIVYICYKAYLNNKDPIKHPYITAYLNKPNFDHFVKFQTDLISKMQSDSGIENFQGLEESEEIPIEYIQTKLKKIIQSRPKESAISNIEYVQSIFIRGIDSFQEMIRRIFLQSYIHKNTIKTKRISKE
jgi:hypothetical protein